jgi:hypothetical protein
MPEAEQAVPASRVVVTSENRAEFMNHKLDIAAPPKAESAEPVKEETAEPEAEAEPEKAEPKPEEPKKEEAKEEKKHPIKERFSELTQQREAAKAEAAKERERAEKAEKEAAELREKLAPPPTQVSAEPKRDQFKTDEEYEDARIDYRADLRLAAREQAQRQEGAKSAWKEGVTEVAKEVPDYQARLDKSTVLIANEVRDAIIDAGKVGPRILLHLADDQEYTASLAKMPLVRALKEIGKLEEKYSTKPAPKAEAKAEPKKEVEVSKAPAPIAPLKGANASADAPVNAQGEYTGTYAQWKADRKAGKIK